MRLRLRFEAPFSCPFRIRASVAQQEPSVKPQAQAPHILPGIKHMSNMGDLLHIVYDAAKSFSGLVSRRNVTIAIDTLTAVLLQDQQLLYKHNLYSISARLRFFPYPPHRDPERHEEILL